MILRATANEERSIQEIYQNMVRKESLWCLSKTIPSLSTVSSAKERQLQTAGAESTGLLLPGSQEEGFLPERSVSISHPGTFYLWLRLHVGKYGWQVGAPSFTQFPHMEQRLYLGCSVLRILGCWSHLPWLPRWWFFAKRDKLRRLQVVVPHWPNTGL